MTGAPRHALVDGVRWSIARAWPAPGAHDRLVVEARAGARVRAGEWRRAAEHDASSGVSLHAEGHDPRLPSLPEWARRGAVVSHRLGKRAVVRMTDSGDFVKVVRPGRAARVVAAHERAEAFAPAFRLSTITHASDDAVAFSALPGQSVAALGATATDDEWAALWSVWADAWAATLQRAVPGDWPHHTATDERGILTTWAEHAATLDPGAAAALRMTAARLGDALEALTPLAPVVAHRDLHDQQMLWAADGAVALLDLDTASLADPGLDLGNLAAHVDLAVRQGRWAPERGGVARRTIEGVATRVGVSVERLAAWETAARFRVACVHLFRPPWRRMAAATLQHLLADTDSQETSCVEH